MAKIYSSKKSSSSKVSTKKTEAGKSETNPRYNVEKISNGYIVEKSWTDPGPNYQYHCVKTYYEKNPIDL